MGIKSFLFFIKKPVHPNTRIKLDLIKSIKLILASYLLSLTVIAIVIPIFRCIQLLGIMPLLSNEIPHFYFVVFFAPILEEFAFRLPLNFQKESILISIVLISSMISWIFLHDVYLLLVYILLITSVSSLFIYSKRKEISIVISLAKKKYFKNVFMFYSLFFALMHLFNYNIESIFQYIIIPLLILPQFIYAFIFGYIRLMYVHGFGFALIVHILLNMTIFLLSNLHS